MDEARQLREFWFGRLPLAADELESRMQFWFGDDQLPELRQRDATIRVRFSPLLERATRGELDAWADGPRRRLSLIAAARPVPAEHLPRHGARLRDDAQALALALSGMQSGADAALDPVERMFFYMPLQHAESLDVQDESVAAYPPPA